MNLADVTLLILRLVVGLTFAAHGAQKAFGWWNGPGYEKWTGVVASMRIHPVAVWTAVSVLAELLGGIMLAAGLVTPFVAMLLIGQSTVILLQVHVPNGFWSRNNGVEFPLSLLAGVVGILGIGPGALSLDAAIGLPTFSDPFLLLLFAIGLAGGLVPVAISHTAKAQEAAAPQGAVTSQR